MKRDYIEDFQILGVGSYSISKKTNFKGKSSFCPWEGGCAIHPAFDTIAAARTCIFNHAKAHIDRETRRFKEKLAFLNLADEQLGTDSFNLATFKSSKHIYKG